MSPDVRRILELLVRSIGQTLEAMEEGHPGSKAKAMVALKTAEQALFRAGTGK